MSGEPTQDDAAAPATEAERRATRGVIPVEVEAPEARSGPSAELEAKLAAAEKEKKDNWDRYLRAAADLENLRKRQKRELEDAKFEAKSKVLKEMLPVVDNLERAIEHATQQARRRRRRSSRACSSCCASSRPAFERLDVHAVEAMGQPFDPNLHEAISQQESDAAAGHGRPGAAARLQDRRAPAAAVRWSSSRRRKRRRASGMSRVVGIDLGTTNSCVAVMDGDAAGRDRERRGRAHDAVGHRLRAVGRAAGRAGRAPPGDDQPREHDLRGQAADGAQVRRRRGRSGTC